MKPAERRQILEVALSVLSLLDDPESFDLNSETMLSWIEDKTVFENLRDRFGSKFRDSNHEDYLLTILELHFCDCYAGYGNSWPSKLGVTKSGIGLLAAAVIEYHQTAPQ